MKTYRMVSWWLRKDALPWPNEALKDTFRRRADRLAAAGADSAIIFGAHFRWDFCRVWEPLHELIRFVADELHARDMILFDHHSSVLTCYFNRDPDRFAHTFSNHRQVLISPPSDVPLPTDELNDWKMVDVATGKPCFLSQYGAQQFCMNNPEFGDAYMDYVRRLFAETGIDGLMSDDAIFYPLFRACACPHCRERFQREYGHELPPAEHLDFWGNWSNPSWRDWVAMRYQTVQDFFRRVRTASPANIPLMSCCSGCCNAASNASALSYEEFIAGGADTVMLEMCGNTPAMNGTLMAQMARQAHLLGIARQHRLPCIGLGYGYSEDAARTVWAFNKFLGAGMWFSSLVHRLGLPDEDMAAMPDDSELLAETFQAEKRFAEWFEGESAAEVAIFFSTSTLQLYGGNQSDFAADYVGLCQHLFGNGYDADVVLKMPSAESSPYSVLVLPSAVCLSEDEKAGLLAWVQSGRMALALGPLGFCDERGERRQLSLAAELGVQVTLPEINRPPAFPDDVYRAATPADCVSASAHWAPLPGLHWFPARCRAGLDEEADGLLRSWLPTVTVPVGWHCRKYRDEQGRLLVHFLASQYEQELDDALEAKRDPASRAYRMLRIVRRIRPSADCCRQFTLPLPPKSRTAELLLPLAGQEPRRLSPQDGAVNFVVPDDCGYFLVRIG